MSDTYNLNRFVNAQFSSYGMALTEIHSGKKSSHWMWFIFPQVAGLGSSHTAQLYAIQNMGEAIAYLQHPVLGERLIEISKALIDLDSNDAHVIFGSPDDMKLRSSMTLFAHVPGGDPVFQLVLDKYFHGIPDQKTLELLSS